MRFVEIDNSSPTYVSNEEAKLVNKVEKNKKVFKKDLNDREVYLSAELVSRNVLLRKRYKGEIYFVRNSHQQII